MKCYYHNDHDGRGAGSTVAKYKNNYNKEDFFEVDYAMDLPLETLKAGEEVWFVDYAFTEKTYHILKQLICRGCNIIWIDHHTSSINLENDHRELKQIRGIRQEGISGAALTYMYCYEINEVKDLPYYVRLISDYDCWQYKLEPDTTYFKLGLETVKFDALDDVWKYLEKDEWCNLDSVMKLIDTGKTIKTYIDNDNTFYREHFSYDTEIGGHKCLVVNKKTNSWVFGEKYNEYPIVMIWVFDGTKFTYSIFSSNKEIDCSKIAESYGGGGHRGAAGFTSTELLFRKKEC